jgi:hypothetical protein
MKAILMGDSGVTAHALQFVMAIWCTLYFILNVPNKHYSMQKTALLDPIISTLKKSRLEHLTVGAEYSLRRYHSVYFL